MNISSKQIFDYLRSISKDGNLEQSQVDVLFNNILSKGVSIKDVATLLNINKIEDKPVSNFKLSQTSLNRLKGVNEDLVKVVKRAIEISEIDFLVVEGLRTLETQKKYVAQGKSQTLKSKHIDGNAVDLAAYVDGKVDWNFIHYYKIADAMQKAAKELNINIRWGAAWGRWLNDYQTSKEAYTAYVNERKKLGKSPFLDAVHFEL